MKTILSLFDHSGVWSGPYERAGYRVIRADIKDGRDVMELTPGVLDTFIRVWGGVHGVLAAPPCTAFTISGARWWPRMDADGSTREGVRLVKQTLRIIKHVKPKWWALENPVGRLPKLVPAIG